MLKELLKKIASELATEKIPYMIIGGQALLIYGEPRLTKDIDITLGEEMEERIAWLRRFPKELGE